MVDEEDIDFNEDYLNENDPTPDSVLKALESIHASSFWGGFQGLSKLAWVKWPTVLASLVKTPSLAMDQWQAFELDEMTTRLISLIRSLKYASLRVPRSDLDQFHNHWLLWMRSIIKQSLSCSSRNNLLYRRYNGESPSHKSFQKRIMEHSPLEI
nr:hypothetical protein [Tanacetum cinerariifolium]